MTPLLLQSTIEKNETAAAVLLFGIIFIIVLIPFIFFILTLQNTLKELQAENRKMKPSHTWLMLIPLFGSIWTFYVVKQVSESLEAEYNTRNIPHKPKPGYNVGLAFAITGVLIYSPFFTGIISLANIVLFIAYWMNVNQHRYAIQQNIHKNN